MRPDPQQGKDGSSQRTGWRRACRLFDLVTQEGGIILWGLEFFRKAKNYPVLPGKRDTRVNFCTVRGILRRETMLTARKTPARARSTSPSVARIMIDSDSRAPDPAILPDHPRLNGFQEYLVEDRGEDLPLFEGWRVLGIVQGGLDLFYDIANIGQLKNASLFFLRMPLEITEYILPE